MKRNILFKSLIDILFVTHCLGALAFVFIAPIGVVGINMANIEVSEWQFVHWLALILSGIAYTVFLLGLYQLRKAARFMLKNNFFNENVATSLRKCGRYFLLVSGLTISMFLMMWINKFLTGTFSLIYDTNIVFILLLAIIGLFFIIQSDVLLSAKRYKEENDLTI